MGIVKDLIKSEKIITPHIVEAFKKVSRANFMIDEYKNMADVDNAFPIGHGQTISQPSTVAFMLEKLQPQLGQKVLDIGSGSGWTTALLAHIVGEKGKIYAVEINPKIFEFGRKNVKRLGFKNIEFINADASGGLAKFSPYDRILVSAEVHKIPVEIKKQLGEAGRAIIPSEGALTLIERIGRNKFREERFPFFAFVPMRGKHGIS